EQGYADAQNNLGNLYAEGKGVSQSYTEAVKWYRLAAEQGDADAQYYLGVCYATGDGVAKNRATAIRWYKKAAAQGNSTAQDNLRKLGVYDW
ncbi:MAG: tetratricopeptide repeat protein, partial [Sodaliphilus sp.]|nr:tetratricopeptide repeat protein [Sodaliphilus sp.]